MTPDEVRQEIGLEPLSPLPMDEQPTANPSGAFILSEFLEDDDLMLEPEQDFVFKQTEQIDYMGILKELSEPLRSRFIKDQQILTHRLNKIMDKSRIKIIKEIDSKIEPEQTLVAEDILIDSELLAPERDALVAAVFLDSKKKFKQGIKLGEDFIKKKYPTVAGIKVKSTVNEQAIRVLDLRSTQLAKSLNDDLLKATQIAISEGIQARKGVSQLKEDIEAIFEKFSGTSGRFNNVGTRAELIIRTELHRLFIEGTLQSFKELKVSKLMVVINAGACEECIEVSADNQTTPLHLSQSVIPVHPRCRCGWVAAQIDE